MNRSKEDAWPAGSTSHAVNKTSLGVADDAAVVRQAIKAIDGPVVVVAHSYGGIPTSVGAADQPNVRHLVYMTSFALDAGESLLGAVGGVAPSWWRMEGDLVVGGTEEEPAPEIFFNDVDPEHAASAVTRLLPQSPRAFTDTLTAAAWRTVPRPTSSPSATTPSPCSRKSSWPLAPDRPATALAPANRPSSPAPNRRLN